MTCREKLKMERPEKVGSQFSGGCCGCPSMYNYMHDPHVCGTRPMSADDCERCWDREIPGTEEERTNMITAVVPRKTFNDSIREVGEIAKKTAEEIYKSTDVLSCLAGIKDSGDRTEFETGAVRDMREGKGRFDLMPLDVVAEYIYKGVKEDGTKHDDKYFFIRDLAAFLKTNNTDYLYSAIAVFEPMAFDYTTTMLLEVAKHFEEGAKKYGPDNWKRGIPVWCYIDSAMRHFCKFLNGDTDERHDRAVIWNLMCCIWEVDYRNKEEK